MNDAKDDLRIAGRTHGTKSRFGANTQLFEYCDRRIRLGREHHEDQIGLRFGSGDHVVDAIDRNDVRQRTVHAAGCCLRDWYADRT